MKHVKTHLVPKALSRATIVLALLTASASAHPGHPGHDMASGSVAEFLVSIPELGRLWLAAVVSGLALFACRGVFRKLP